MSDEGYCTCGHHLDHHHEGGSCMALVEVTEQTPEGEDETWDAECDCEGFTAEARAAFKGEE